MHFYVFFPVCKTWYGGEWKIVLYGYYSRGWQHYLYRLPCRCWTVSVSCVFLSGEAVTAVVLVATVVHPSARVASTSQQWPRCVAAPPTRPRRYVELRMYDWSTHVVNGCFPEPLDDTPYDMRAREIVNAKSTHNVITESTCTLTVPCLYCDSVMPLAQYSWLTPWARNST